MCDMEENWWCKMCFTDEQKPYKFLIILTGRKALTRVCSTSLLVQFLQNMEPKIMSDIKEVFNTVSTENRITCYVCKASNSISTY